MRCASSLGKALRGKLAEILAETGKISILEVSSEEGLKTRIIEDPLFNVQAVSGTSFRVTASPGDISRAIVRDYYYGYLRVKKQWESVELLIQNRNIAWAIVSSYYCSFFCAVEALRLCGCHALSLSPVESNTLFESMSGSHIDNLRKTKHFKGVLSEDFTEIGYTTTGDKPHYAAWQMLSREVLSKIPRKNAAWMDAIKFSNMCKGQSGWEIPSEIRNRWNYRDPTYFSTLGEQSANPFLKLIADPDAASSWIRGQVTIRNENDSAASMAALASLLHLAITDTYDFGFRSAKNII